MTLFALAIIVIVGWTWGHGKPAHPLWVDIHEGDGMVLSLAAGKDASGKEVIVAGGGYRSDTSGHDLRVICLDATDGHMRWETREDEGLPNIGKAPDIGIDAAGDVLVGWHYWGVARGKHPVITKLSGVDGHKFWEWKALAGGETSGILAVPVPDHLGRVWIAGIRQVAEGDYRRFLALLDTRDGATRWEISLNVARDANDRRATIHPLQDGDALVIAPPLGGEGRPPWLIQRISAAHGTVLWPQELIRDNDRNLTGLMWAVDEIHNQLVVFWSVVTSGQMHLDVITYDLATGQERWRSRDKSADEFWSGPYGVTLSDKGDPVVWGHQVYEKTHTKWWRWHKDEELGFWLPERVTHRYEQPQRITFSGINGSVREHRFVADPDERISAILSRPMKTDADVLLLRNVRNLQQETLPWRALRLNNNGSAPWLGYYKKEAEGPAASRLFCDHAVLTPSGHLVMAGDPAEDRRVWRITVW